MTARMPRVRRTAAVTLVLTALLVSGCSAAGSDGVVGLDAAPSALVTISATGVVAEPGAAAADTDRTAAGFVVDADGVIVTTADAVVGAGSIVVRVGGAAEPVPATLVGAAECLDLAVLRLDGAGDDAGVLPHLAWRRGAVTEGTVLHAVAAVAPGGAAPSGGAGPATGTPATVDGSVTEVVEPLVRPWAAARSGIRHDLVLDAGASGTALLDDEGGVAAIAHVEGGEGDAALTAAVARSAVESIVADPRSVGSLGIGARPWADADATVSGVWVTAVSPDGPAATAGVQPGDVVQRLGDRDVGADGTLAAYCSVLAGAGDDPLALQVYRPATDQVLAGDTGGAPLAVVSTGEVLRSGATTTAVDASGLVRVEVPVEWASVDGAGFTDDAGNAWYSLVAAPSAERFRTDRSAPGVQVAVPGARADVVALLDALATPYDAECAPLEQVRQYDDGVYAGAFSRFSCDGAVATVLSVRSARGVNVVVVAQVASPTDQLHTLPRILSTFVVGQR